MLHLGDITKISGYTAPITDCVVGGSPCQDLSVAGKRAGLDGERSGLFMEQIRIIKEMRDRDVRENGRSGVDVRPRYMVWENVPGAFSSNKGEDFRIVLEETARIKDKTAHVPMPDKWQTSGCILGDGWSIAWRVLDAQFWGVPQRRRRIALVADFGGHSAPEILFVRKGVCGDTQQSQPQRKATPADAARGTGADDTAYTMKIRSGVDVDSSGKAAGKGALIQTEKSGTLSCVQDQYLFQPVIYDARGNGDGKTSCNLTSRDEGSVGDYSNLVFTAAPVYSVENHPADSRVDIDDTGKVQTLTSRMGTGGGNVPMVMEPAVCYSLDPLSSNSMKSSNPHSGCHETDVARTIDTTNPDPSKNQGGVAIVETYQTVTGPLMANSHPGSYTGQDAFSDMLVAGPCGINGDVAGTLDSSYYKGCGMRQGVEREVVRTRYTVRRLTPLECERLQGYPDGWTDIGEYIDSNGKKKQSSDAARYKALGNSIALPPWKWVMKRLCACYERDATLASLFDGISGFPFIWTQLNGLGSVLWTSEIEEFPIAVCKKHFGDETIGEEGDFYEATR